MLLNPGANYSLLDEAASLDLAKSAGVQVVIVPKLAPTVRTGPKDNSPKLKVEIRAVDVATAKTLYSFTALDAVMRRG